MNIKELIEKGNYTIILDTNVLLNIYRSFPVFSDFALNCLNMVYEHIVIPATVFLEYRKHYRSEFSKMEKRIKESSKETEKQIDVARRKIIKSCDVFEHLEFTNIDELKNDLNEKLDAVKKAFDDFFEDRPVFELIQHSWNGIDHLLILIDEVKAAGRVMNLLTQEEIYDWSEDGEKRYKNKTPPGFEDAKNKYGVRKYSDFFIWREIIRYAKTQKKNIIFVTDDTKVDWWETIDGLKQFHPKLIEEFANTGQSIIPMTSKDFYKDVSDNYGIVKSDAIDIALRITENEFYRMVNDRVFESIEDELIYHFQDYIVDETAHIGSEGLEDLEITDYKFTEAHQTGRLDNTIVYNFKYSVQIEGVSYEYMGRDDDTKEVILSEGRDHTFEGNIVVQIERETEIYYDFEDDDSFDNSIIIDGNIEELNFSDRMEQEGEFGYCPDCGVPLNLDNEMGGFCTECAQNH